MSTWQVQGAKQRFSEMLRAAETGEPQFITKHGEPVAVVIDIEQFRRSREQRPSLAKTLLAASGAIALDEDLPLPERHRDPDRAAGLFEEPEQ